MIRRRNIEDHLCKIGQLLELKREEIKLMLKQRKHPIIMAVLVMLAAVVLGNNAMVFGKKYIGVSPLDFDFFQRFPFSLLF
jgi:hypothetical protein